MPTLLFMARQGLRVLALAKKPVSEQQNTVDHADIATGLIFLEHRFSNRKNPIDFR